MLPAGIVISAIAALFEEAYEGPKVGSFTWFTDSETNSSVFATLQALSAEEASTSLDGSGMPGSTIASHVEHLRWSLALSNALVRGEQPDASWEESWKVCGVDAEGWSRLQEALREEYRTLLQDMQQRTDLSEEYVTPGISIVAHGAYHLGAIRQMARQLQRNEFRR
jgi:hypothetical protein